jgi:hypothetical protein
MPEMRKLMRSLMPICGLFLIGGCGPDPVPVLPPAGLLFCDAEEARRFTQEELDWRSAYAPWNLRRDFKTNLTLEEECPAS